jgi:hypothetical protein
VWRADDRACRGTVGGEMSARAAGYEADFCGFGCAARCSVKSGNVPEYHADFSRSCIVMCSNRVVRFPERIRPCAHREGSHVTTHVLLCAVT